MAELGEKIKKYFEARPDTSLTSAASALNIGEGELLAALEGILSTRLDGVDHFGLLEEMAGWGKLRLVVRNSAAVSEMLGTLEGVRFAKGWLTVENDYFHLHVKADELRLTYLFHRRGGEGVRPSYSVQFLDNSGGAVLKVFLLETSVGSPQLSRFEKLSKRKNVEHA
jgi:putative heme iron utilization protein